MKRIFGQATHNFRKINAIVPARTKLAELEGVILSGSADAPQAVESIF